MTGPVAPVPGVPTGNTYHKYSTSNPVERAIVGRFLRTLDRALPATPPTLIVEIGAGEGEIAQRVRRRFPMGRVLPLDLPDPALGASWRERKLRGAFGDAGRLPLPDRSADLVLAIEVLEHLHDPRAALSEIARVAKEAVVLSVPLEPLWRVGNVLRGRYLREWGNTPGHVQHWGRRSFLRLCSEYLSISSVHRPLPWTMVVGIPR